MNQPYQAPAATVAVASDETYLPKLFATSGRIGRMRYFVYAALLGVMYYLVLGIAVGVIGALSGGLQEAQGGAGMMVLGLLYFALLIIAFIMGVILMVRRINDFNTSGWLVLLMLVPIANIILMLMLLFRSGSDGANNYGPAPQANSTGIKVGFFVLLAVWILSMFLAFAVAIPAYQDYVERASQYQMEYQGGY